jgi:hypothetical protein
MVQPHGRPSATVVLLAQRVQQAQRVLMVLMVLMVPMVSRVSTAKLHLVRSFSSAHRYN